jgi:hypothetical protein
VQGRCTVKSMLELPNMVTRTRQPACGQRFQPLFQIDELPDQGTTIVWRDQFGSR